MEGGEVVLVSTICTYTNYPTVNKLQILSFLSLIVFSFVVVKILLQDYHSVILPFM